jgi:hypothetical protein
VLRKAIESEFSSKVARIVIPPRPERAVLGGAVYFALEPKRLRFRRSRLTYGTTISERFDPTRHPESKKFLVEETNANYCKGVFKTLIREGELVEVDTRLEFSFNPIFANQTRMTFELFSSSQPGVAFTDDPGVVRLGHFDVPMPDVTAGRNRSVGLVVHVGLSELRVDATDQTSGLKAHTKIHFSSSYFANVPSSEATS